MCRYDSDDYEWYVDGINAAFSDDSGRNCADCGRRIEAGEIHTRYTAMEVEDEWDNPLHFVAQWPTTPSQKFVDPNGQWFIVDEDIAEPIEELGYLVDELHEFELHPRDPIHHHQCAQCYAGNDWLVRVCEQGTVLVTQMDLIEHRYDYAPDVLGPDFITLATLAEQRWRTKDFGRLIPPHVVSRLANDAADYAIAGGVLHP